MFERIRIMRVLRFFNNKCDRPPRVLCFPLLSSAFLCFPLLSSAIFANELSLKYFSPSDISPFGCKCG